MINFRVIKFAMVIRQVYCLRMKSDLSCVWKGCFLHSLLIGFHLGLKVGLIDLLSSKNNNEKLFQCYFSEKCQTIWKKRQ